MIPASLDQISAQTIQSLITDSVPESRTLDYKETLPSGKDADKREFLYDISSFANAAGGDIVYGVRERRDSDGKTTGLPAELVPINQESVDTAKLRLEEIIRNGIAPRVRISIREIQTSKNSYVLVLRIPRSISAPHMVTAQGVTKFYSRNSSGKYQMDLDEIRYSFLASDSQSTRIQDYIKSRIALIQDSEIPLQLPKGPILVLHIIPIYQYLNNAKIDIGERQDRLISFRPIRSTGWDGRYNFDGHLCWSLDRRSPQNATGYCQLFYNGTVEAAETSIFDRYSHPDSSETIGYRMSSTAYERSLVAATKSYISGLLNRDVTGPCVVSLSLIRCKGISLYVDNSFNGGDGYPLDRDRIMFPKIIVEEPSHDTDYAEAMKTIFDSVWNAFGYPESLNYDTNGRWTQGR